MTIDAETRMAYVDGELDEIARRRVERAMADDPALAAAVARDQALRETVRARFAGYAEGRVPDRFRAMLDGQVTPIGAGVAPAKIPERRRRWLQGLAVAATLVLGIAIGRQVEDVGPVVMRGDALVAQGPLASALDTQLAATQPSDAAVRIGLTFRSTAGTVCRTFEGRKLQGIACRDDGRWALVRTAAGERVGVYRQASSGAPGMIAAAQAMMAGAPFGASAEAQARQKGWR